MLGFPKIARVLSSFALLCAQAEKTTLQLEKLLVNLEKLDSKAGRDYLSYEDTFTFYSDLARQYPDWIKVYAASELYPDADKYSGEEGRPEWQKKMANYKCGPNFVDIQGSKRKKVDGDQPCETLLVFSGGFGRVRKPFGGMLMLFIGEDAVPRGGSACLFGRVVRL